MYKHLFALLLLLSPSLAARAAPPLPPATTSQPGATASAPAGWTTLLQQLGASDFAQREAAQKQLDQVSWRELPFLQKSADAAADPEIKARLTARVAALQEDLAINPPPISVELENASLPDVADALSKALGIKIDPYPSRVANGTFDLSATDKPFWEVFTALSRQHPFTLQDSGGALRLLSQSNGFRNGIIVGPVAIFPSTLNRQRTANLQTDPAAQLTAETLAITSVVAFDPRLRLTKYAAPYFTEIVDDAGNTLYKSTNTPSLSDLSRTLTLQSFSTSLPLPEKHSSRIASIKGVIHYVALAAEDHFEIADIAKKSGDSFEIGGNTLRISRFLYNGNPDNADIYLNLDFTRKPQPDANPNPVYPTATLLDDNGRVIFTNLLRGSMGTSTSGGSYVPPFKLRISTPTRTKEITAPFELKNVPLP